MAISLTDLARIVDGSLHGDGDIEIHGADIIRDVQAGQITFAENSKLIAQLADCQAAAVIIADGQQCPAMPSIQVANVQAAFAKIVRLFRPQYDGHPVGVAAAAVVSPSAVLAENVSVHANVVIGDDVRIGAGCTIHPGVQIMAGSRLAENVTIFPNAVLYENTQIGARSIIHAGVVIGAYGFGYATIAGKHELSPQLGYVRIGDDVEIGAGSTIDRGTYGATVIGDGTKIDNQVMIAHNCQLGRHNIICSQVGIAGSTTTGDYVVMAGQVGVRDHVHIGKGAMLGAKAGVMSDIPAGQPYVGIPATPERTQMLIQASLMRLPEMKKQLKRLQRTVDQLASPETAIPKQEAA